MLVGIVYGLVGSFFGRAVRDFPLIGPALVISLGYLSFLTAEIFEFSGIITSLIAGMLMQHYLLKAMKHDARIGLETILKVTGQA
jgi:NhaP-type Na+/H+ or K+/H+ antiporter